MTYLLSLLVNCFTKFAGESRVRRLCPVSTGLERLLHRLDLTQGETGEASTTWLGEAGENAMNMRQRLFGGMVVAQTIVAAGRTHTEKKVHSIQTSFLRGGRADSPLEYRVERLFEGRTYGVVRVGVFQDDEMISHSQVGVTSGIDGGPERQEPTTATTTLDATVNRSELQNRPNWQNQPVEVRIDPAIVNDGSSTLETWLKPAGAMPDDPLLHQAVLGFVSDRAFMSVAWKPHGRDLDFTGSSLEHSLWFHRPVRFDDWHVYAMHSPTLSSGRGLIQGTIHHQDGTHVLTATQQGTFRAKP